MAPRLKDYRQAVEMYEAGLSLQVVAKFYGMSRQGMWDILRRRTTLRPQQRHGADNHFHRGTRAEGHAQNVLEVAIRKGIVIRRARCETCGTAATFKDGRTAIQAHHPDYNKPLDVMWLCQPCHHKWHKENRAIPLERR